MWGAGGGGGGGGGGVKGGGGRIGQGMGCWGMGVGRGGGGGGGGETYSCVYRNKLSVDLKQSSDSAVTASRGGLFQPGINYGP